MAVLLDDMLCGFLRAFGIGRAPSQRIVCQKFDVLLEPRAFERGGELVVQFVSLDEASEGQGGWLTMMRSVEGSGASGQARFVVAVGVEAVLAGELAHARGLSLRPSDAQPIGPGCALCHREGCTQRSLPPRGRRLHFDRMRRGTTPFEFGEPQAGR